MPDRPRVLVLNGPNLNLLGRREPEVYGETTYEELRQLLRRWGDELELAVEEFQTNHEGELIDRIQAAPGKFRLIVINPGGYTHTSVALHDAIRAAEVPAIEIHLSNPYAREPFRRRSLVAGACRGSICGFGPLGYRLALLAGRALLFGETIPGTGASSHRGGRR